ncbi:ankyrin repeat domain-containing protein [Wolbachia endosymbiont of Frankliniella intonsa]|uniref:ankyrin repeat domain-containing protein n=1 Tax=Wolbachia endosymbiont of Frankliniella intonsa TaxID=2902422 RepID=UPI00244EBF04|nr:ankyrin repeat domain-containing protein [Wolbachia endosymbiont of Frankliniella intonsa]WGJ61619.1 ankyrin repeat domain-containing protein [Wolbachia endosymbiont of Frankliniella intonsa]
MNMIGNLTYEDVKKFVTDNPNIASQEFGEKLKQSGPTDAKIFDLLADAIYSERHGVSDDSAVFLRIVELFAQLDIKVKKSSGGRTMLDIAVENKQADVVRILLNSGKFEEEEKIIALNSAIIQVNVQGFEPFLDYIDHAKILEALNTATCNEDTDIMKVLLDNKRFTGEEKVQALSHASIGGELTKVRLLLKYMKGVPEDGIRNLLKIIEEGKLSLREQLQIDSEFKVDFRNSDHNKYLSSCVIIALLRSAINKKEKQNTPDGAESNVSNTRTGLTLNNDDIRNLCLDIDRVTKQDSTVTSFEDLQKRLRRKEINLQSKCEKNAVLEYAIKDQNLNVIKFLLQNGMTIINAIGQEGRYYVSKIEGEKSILCFVVSYTDDDNAEILSTLLQSVNAEQSKLNPEDELYRLYQKLKDDAFCTAFAEKNSVAATALIQNDREIIVPHGSATNKEQETFHIETSSVSNSNRNVISRPVATVPPVSTNGNNNKNEAPVSTRTGPTVTPNNDNKANGFGDAQLSPPHEKETKYKKKVRRVFTPH